MGSRVGPEVTRTCSPARSRVGAEEPQERLDDRVHLGQPALAREPRRERARVRLDHGDAALAQRAHVGDHRRMLPHAAVHRGRHQHRAARGQQEGAEEIVREPVGRLREDVRRGGRDEHGVGALGERDVLHGIWCLRIEEVLEHGASGERPPRERSDELARVRRGHDGDAGPEAWSAPAAGRPPCTRRCCP